MMYPSLPYIFGKVLIPISRKLWADFFRGQIAAILKFKMADKKIKKISNRQYLCMKNDVPKVTIPFQKGLHTQIKKIVSILFVMVKWPPFWNSIWRTKKIKKTNSGQGLCMKNYVAKVTKHFQKGLDTLIKKDLGRLFCDVQRAAIFPIQNGGQKSQKTSSGQILV